MYIDHDNKIVFIHIPRTGGTSIKSALNLHDKIYKEDVYHMSANDIPKECEDYFKFTFVRNPFDRFVSLYFYSSLPFISILSKLIEGGIGPDIRTGTF